MKMNVPDRGLDMIRRAKDDHPNAAVTLFVFMPKWIENKALNRLQELEGRIKLSGSQN